MFGEFFYSLNDLERVSVLDVERDGPLIELRYPLNF